MELTLKDQNKQIEDLWFKRKDEQSEGQIVVFLKEGFSPKEIFEKIKNNYDVHQVTRFLYTSGLNKTLFEFSIQRLEKDQPVAWPYILKVFIKYEMIPNEELKQLLFHHWLKNEAKEQALFACKEWEEVSPQFQQFCSDHIKNLEEKYFVEEKDLLEQLHFVQATNLLKEEEEIIKKLCSLKPRNPKYKEMQKELEEKQALLTIEEEQKTAVRKKKSFTDYASYLSLKKSSLEEVWMKSLLALAKADPSNTKNLALFLCFCGWPKKAIQILEMHISKISDYWFYLEWILETKEHAKGLELINRLFEEIKEGEALFLPLIYIKSQLLYGMGKKNEAIEYLTAISQVQPNYKSVQYLLDRWLKGL